VGSQIAVAGQVTSGGPTIAVLVSSKDDALARRALRHIEDLSGAAGVQWTGQTYTGVDIRDGAGGTSIGGGVFGGSVAYAIVDGTVVVGSGVPAVEGVIDADQGASSLGDDATFRTTRDALPRSLLGMAYVNTGNLIDGFLPQIESGIGGLSGPCGRNGAQSLESIRAYRGLGVSLSAESDGVLLELGVAFDRSRLPDAQRNAATVPDHENRVLSFTPKAAYGLAALSGADRLAGRALDGLACTPGASEQIDRLGVRELVGNLAGDLGVEVGPGTGPAPGGALVAAVTDDGKMQSFLDGLADRLSNGTADVHSQSYHGTKISSVTVSAAESMGWEPAWAVVDHTGLLASSPGEVRAAIDAHSGANVTSAPTFRRASAHVARENQGMVYVDVGGILDAVRGSIGAGEAGPFDEVTKNIRPVKAMILSGTNSGDVVREQWFFLIP